MLKICLMRKSLLSLVAAYAVPLMSLCVCCGWCVMLRLVVFFVACSVPEFLIRHILNTWWWPCWPKYVTYFKNFEKLVKVISFVERSVPRKTVNDRRKWKCSRMLQYNIMHYALLQSLIYKTSENNCGPFFYSVADLVCRTWIQRMPGNWILVSCNWYLDTIT
jgi:hypothetical protein